MGTGRFILKVVLKTLMSDEESSPTLLALFDISLLLIPGLPDPGLPNEPEAVPPGHPDLPPHYCQLWLDCS